jgi:hypothetical protein
MVLRVDLSATQWRAVISDLRVAAEVYEHDSVVVSESQTLTDSARARLLEQFSTLASACRLRATQIEKALERSL